MKPVRENAAQSEAPGGVAETFEHTYRLRLADLAELYRRDFWKHSPQIGGNKWGAIALQVERCESPRRGEVGSAGSGDQSRPGNAPQQRPGTREALKASSGLTKTLSRNPSRTRQRGRDGQDRHARGALRRASRSATPWSLAPDGIPYSRFRTVLWPESVCVAQ
jgi:hypothetical protein